MHQVHKPEVRVQWTSIKIEAKVHYFVKILNHKVNTQLFIKYIGLQEINKLFVSFKGALDKYNIYLLISRILQRILN